MKKNITEQHETCNTIVLFISLHRPGGETSQPCRWHFCEYLGVTEEEEWRLCAATPSDWASGWTSYWQWKVEYYYYFFKKYFKISCLFQSCRTSIWTRISPWISPRSGWKWLDKRITDRREKHWDSNERNPWKFYKCSETKIILVCVFCTKRLKIKHCSLHDPWYHTGIKMFLNVMEVYKLFK